ncbi:hypothetical protein EVAR_45751_1 [Eumeta japonica]|uniref:Uncharacterized protein n=1 Tax=Eumeta variegata TaxID=151549 RepID=A0A4C1YN05_EUMVA|nr:hypothetical protein EVAR_45751_1 [Eumeta japonica]
MTTFWNRRRAFGSGTRYVASVDTSNGRSCTDTPFPATAASSQYKAVASVKRIGFRPETHGPSPRGGANSAWITGVTASRRCVCRPDYFARRRSRAPGSRGGARAATIALKLNQFSWGLRGLGAPGSALRYVCSKFNRSQVYLRLLDQSQVTLSQLKTLPSHQKVPYSIPTIDDSDNVFLTRVK